LNTRSNFIKDNYGSLTFFITLKAMLRNRCLLSSPVFAQTDTRGAAQPDKNTAMSARELRAPKVIFFDVNETLLDLTAIAKPTTPS